MGDLGGEEVVTWDDLEYREGLYYQKFTDVPFTGKTTGQTQGTYKDGLLDGPYVSYYNNDNGQLCRKGHYKNGEKDGPWVGYYYDGQLMDKGHYKNGKKDGPWVSYRKDRTVDEKDTGTYKNGVKVD
jgi:antitoxin component YwqK of YwqJK toxin-antitoxin module